MIQPHKMEFHKARPFDESNLFCSSFKNGLYYQYRSTHPTSLVMEEFLDVDLGDISKSESDL